MNEVQAARSRPNLLRWAIVCAAVIGVAAVLYVIGAASIKPKQQAGLEAFKRGELAGLVLPATPSPAPATAFTDAAGHEVTLADFKGQVVVMNLWATWCAPCIKEMPTLARLQATYAVAPLKVVAVSVDRAADDDKARAFIAGHPPLELYRDPSYRLAFAMEPRAAGFPTTVIYDKRGNERARLSGGADWASPEARALVERLLAD